MKFLLLLVLFAHTVSAFDCPQKNSVVLPQFFQGSGKFPPDGNSTAYTNTTRCYWVIPRVNGSYAEVTILTPPNKEANSRYLLFTDSTTLKIYYDSQTWMGYASPDDIQIKFSPSCSGDFQFSWLYKPIPYSNNPDRVTLTRGSHGTVVPLYKESKSIVFTSAEDVGFQAACNPEVSMYYMWYGFIFLGEGINGRYLGSYYYLATDNTWIQEAVNNRLILTLVTIPQSTDVDYGVLLIKTYKDIQNIALYSLRYAPRNTTADLQIVNANLFPSVVQYYGGAVPNSNFYLTSLVTLTGTLDWQAGDYLRNGTVLETFGVSRPIYLPQQLPGRLNTLVIRTDQFHNETVRIQVSGRVPDSYSNVPGGAYGVYSSGNYPFSSLPKDNTLSLSTAQSSQMTVSVADGADNNSAVVVKVTNSGNQQTYRLTSGNQQTISGTQFSFSYDSGSNTMSPGAYATFSFNSAKSLELLVAVIVQLVLFFKL